MGSTAETTHATPRIIPFAEAAIGATLSAPASPRGGDDISRERPGPSIGPCIGTWRIFAADLWDREHLDLVGPAHVTFHADGDGEMAFGALEFGLDCKHGEQGVFFTFAGFDEGDEINGAGSAEIDDDGTLDIEIRFHLGDEAELKARRE